LRLNGGAAAKGKDTVSMRQCARRPLDDPILGPPLGPILGLALFLGGCAHGLGFGDATAANDPDINVFPANYKPDILGAMHAYLSDPTGIRDAGLSDPALKAVGGAQRYVVCVRFNAKKRGNDYAGVKEVAAVFIAGRFDRFVETRGERPDRGEHPEHEDRTEHEQCAGATYAPFPELGRLSR
jgi:hypothetical protein